MTLKWFFTFVFVFGLSVPSFAQGLHSKIVARQEAKDSADMAKAAKESLSFKVEQPYQQTLESVSNWLRKEGYSIDEADPLRGIVSTAIDKLPNSEENGRKVIITLIKESETTTTVKIVAASYQSPKKRAGLGLV